MGFDTASSIITDAFTELGAVPVAFLADVYGSTEDDVVQMRSLLKALGRHLVRKHQWNDLQKTHTFDTVDGTASYALPADFGRLLPATEWNRSTEQRLLGPLAAQGWQVLQSTSAVAGITYWFRKVGNKIHLYPTPTAVETIAFEYQSLYWVVPASGGFSVPNTETPSANGDTLWLDPRVLVTGLKLAWRTAKRMDTAAEENEHREALAMAEGADAGAPDLSMTGGGGVPLITEANAPETGFGS